MEFDAEAEDQTKNMTTFTTPAAQILFKGDIRPVRFFTKHDPSKAVWGPLKLTFTSEVDEPAATTTYTSQTTTSYSYPYTSTAVGPIQQSGGAVTSSATYVPGGGAAEIKVQCRKCGDMQDYQTYCGKCGEAL